jgi:hypothetical protein
MRIVAASEAPPGEGSPYRALEVTAKPRSIATAAKPDEILGVVPIVLVITTPTRTISVRADIFAELPAQIVERIAAARAELAPARRALRESGATSPSADCGSFRYTCCDRMAARCAEQREQIAHVLCSSPSVKPDRCFGHQQSRARRRSCTYDACGGREHEDDRVDAGGIGVVGLCGGRRCTWQRQRQRGLDRLDHDADRRCRSRHRW